MNVITVSTNVERLMGRAILDEAFRTQLFTNPEAAAREAGLALSDAEMNHLKLTLDQLKTRQTVEQFNQQVEGDIEPLGRWV